MTWILRVTAGSGAGRSLELESGSYVIGRATDNDVPLNDTGASRRHIRLTVNADGVSLTDLGSSNGTLVDDQRVEGQIALKAGSRIQIGRSELLLSAEQATGELRLVGLEGPAVNAEITLKGERTTLGRDPECDLQMEDAAVSGLHAMIESQVGRWMLRDCNSHNGTFINDQRLERPVALRGGDVIRIGASALEFIDGRIDDLHGEAIPGYRVIERVGTGSLGVVYKARREATGELVALKLLDPTITGDAAQRARLINAARTASRIQHPNIQPVLDAGLAGDRTWIVSAWAANGSLADLVASGDEIPPPIITALAADAARGLAAAAAAGVVHQGLRMGDIMIDRDGIGRIADLGLAAEWSHEETVDGRRPSYRSTEEIGGAAASERSNQFSLGAVLYHALTGRPPFAGGDAAEVAEVAEVAEAHRSGRVPAVRDRRADVPEDLAAIIETLMAREPEHRYPDWESVTRELEPVARAGAAAERAVAAPSGAASGGTRIRSTRLRPHPRHPHERMPQGIRRLMVLVGTLLVALVLLAIAQRYLH